mmetsp:Transcript_30990/g.101023  ORF Transcript_30990/g.101023 Transcript_30990/m.101023 type:complete len:235 (-) Transcript_30990:262-966(-)
MNSAASISRRHSRIMSGSRPSSRRSSTVSGSPASSRSSSSACLADSRSRYLPRASTNPAMAVGVIMELGVMPRCCSRSMQATMASYWHTSSGDSLDRHSSSLERSDMGRAFHMPCRSTANSRRRARTVDVACSQNRLCTSLVANMRPGGARANMRASTNIMYRSTTSASCAEPGEKTSTLGSVWPSSSTCGMRRSVATYTAVPLLLSCARLGRTSRKSVVRGLCRKQGATNRLV